MSVLAALLGFLLAQDDGNETLFGLNIFIFILVALAIVALLLWLFGRR